SKRYRENEESARQQPRTLAIDLLPYTPSSSERALLEVVLSDDAVARESASTHFILKARQQLRDWLFRYGLDNDRRRLVPSSQGLAWLEPWEAGTPEERPNGGPAVAAARHADARLTDLLFDRSPKVASLDFPLAVPSE